MQERIYSRFLTYLLFLDATESIHMLGKIPNARGAVFDFYRDYDDIRIYDVTYYLQLNHSRLITSRLLWRPEIKKDLKVSTFFLI